MNQSRLPPRAYNQARTAARLRRMRHRHRRRPAALSIELGVLRALALHAADPCAPLDLRPLRWPSERELFERIFGSKP